MTVDLERRQAACAQVIRRLTLELALAEVVRALSRRGVRPLLLKGPAISSWLYDYPDERPYDDIDLLLSPNQFQAAEHGLAELGFEPLHAGWDPDERDHHDVWRRTAGRTVTVELHRTLSLLSARSSLVWDRLSQGARSIEVDGEAVAVPSKVACAFIVALHAAQHGPGTPTPIEDLRRALERGDVQIWRAAAVLARELGAVETFAAGLQLDPAGRALTEELGLGNAASTRLLRLLATAPPPGALGIEQLILSRGVSARLRLVLRKVVPSRARIREWLPLARRGGWGLCVAYIYRPFWLAAKLPRGLGVWLSAATARTGDERSSTSTAGAGRRAGARSAPRGPHREWGRRA